MAIQGPVRVEFGEVFPLGAFAVAVEPVRDFERSSRENTVQARDRDTGELVWAVEVLDADPAARASDRSVKVKITAPVMPVLPDVMAGTPFRPAEFEGLRMRPYVNSNTNRLAYSFTARSMRPAGSGSAGKPTAGASNTSGKSNNAAAAA